MAHCRRHRTLSNDVSRQLVLICTTGFVFLCQPISVVNAPSPTKCSVATIFGLKTADCRNRDLRDIPATMASDMKVLRFTDNQLVYLGIDAFHAYQALQHIYAGRNRIQTVAPDAFRGLRNLQILDMQANRLRTVPTPAFRHISSVRILSLKSNPITYLTADAFRALGNLEELNLENCWLNRVQPGALAGLTLLGELNLVNNELTALPAETEHDLPPSLTVLRLHRNPWRCDCRLRWLRRFVDAHGAGGAGARPSINWDFAAHNTPVCSSPELLNGVSWRHLAADQFACPPSQVVGNGTTSVELHVGANASIACVVGGDPPPDVTWMKGSSYVAAELVAVKTEAAASEGRTPLLHSVLRLTGVTQHDAGDYKCIAANPAGRSEVTYKVWVVDGLRGGGGGRQEKPRDGRNTDTGDEDDGFGGGVEVLVGVVLGLVVLAVALGTCVVLVVVRRRQLLQNISRGRKDLTNVGNSYVVPGSTAVSLKSNHVVGGTHDAMEVHQTWNGRPNNSDFHHRMLPGCPHDATSTIAAETVHVAPFQTLPDSVAVPDDYNDDDEDDLSSQFAMRIFATGAEPLTDPAAANDEVPSLTGDATPSPPAADSCEFQRDDSVKKAPVDVPRQRPDVSSGSSPHDADDRDSNAEDSLLTARPDIISDEDRRSTEHLKDNISATSSSTSHQLPPSFTPSHCANPVCLRDRRLLDRPGSSSLPPGTDLCSHRLALSSRSASPDHGGVRVTVRQRSNYPSGYVVDVSGSPRQCSPSIRASPRRRRNSSSRTVDLNYCSTLPPRRLIDVDDRGPPRGSRGHPAMFDPAALYGSTMPRHRQGAWDHRRHHRDPSISLSGSSSALDIRDLGVPTSPAFTVLGPSRAKSPSTLSPIVVATSIHDILSPPFGPPPTANGPKPTTGKKFTLKPGDNDEFGTAV